MAKKKTKKSVLRKKSVSKSKKSKPKSIDHKKDLKNFPTLKLKKETDIAMDFATKVYRKFDKIVKSIVLFGSTVKQTNIAGSDIDIVVLIDDVAIKWDQELIAWYREELEKLIKSNPYQNSLHINTVKLSTWWEDLMRGDPVVINILRYGEAMIDLAGFFNPLKAMLIEGKIKSTPEAIYSALQRAPQHIARSKLAELNAIDGLFWSMVDSAHAALIASHVSPASPEHVPADLKENFVNQGKLDMKYVVWYRDLLVLHKKIAHGEVKDLKGVEIDAWQQRAEEFLNIMAKLVNDLVE
ncbi:MAG: nucleotidyltransferase domain-containing protein [Nanoarchaeota archaeon]|nr:nucleotidyltransferase domain-containing protein [Nanoarchaeota archaeon]